MKLTKRQQRALCALHQGSSLKSHRHLDGSKVYKLHPLDGAAETVSRTTVVMLRLGGLIHSNQKFPAATYLLTEKGRRLAQQLTGSPTTPLTAKNF